MDQIEELRAAIITSQKAINGMQEEIESIHRCRIEFTQSVDSLRDQVDSINGMQEDIMDALEKSAKVQEKWSEDMAIYIELTNDGQVIGKYLKRGKNALMWIASIAASIYAILLLIGNEVFKKITGLF